MDQMSTTKSSQSPLDMMRMLKNLENEDNEDIEEEYSALDSIDVDSASVEELLGALKIEERLAFDKMIEDEQGLASLIEIRTPWWISSGVENPTDNIRGLNANPNHLNSKSANQSTSIPKLRDLMSKPPSNLVLLTMVDYMYHLINVRFAYVATVRTMNGEFDYSLFLQLSVVASIQTSNGHAFKSVVECIDILRYKAIGVPGMNPQSIQLFMHDLGVILQSKQMILRALSEIGKAKGCKMLIKKLKLLESMVDSGLYEDNCFKIIKIIEERVDIWTKEQEVVDKIALNASPAVLIHEIEASRTIDQGAGRSGQALL